MLIVAAGDGNVVPEPAWYEDGINLLITRQGEGVNSRLLQLAGALLADAPVERKVAMGEPRLTEPGVGQFGVKQDIRKLQESKFAHKLRPLGLINFCL